MNCDGLSNVGVTHSNPQLKTKITLPWKAPYFTDGQNKVVEFKFTVVKDYNNFWIANPASNTVTITKASSDAEPEEPEAESEGAEAEGAYAEGNCFWFFSYKDRKNKQLFPGYDCF